MAKKIRFVPPKNAYPLIIDIGPAEPELDPDDVARALGAESVHETLTAALKDALVS